LARVFASKEIPVKVIASAKVERRWLKACLFMATKERFMKILKQTVMAIALVLGLGTFAFAQNGAPTGNEPPVAGGANGNPAQRGVNESTAPQTAGKLSSSGHRSHHKHHKHRHHAERQ
jgi:hypothetical protein